MPANPRHRARCDRHEARAGIVALISCCLVRPSAGGLGPLGEIVTAQQWRFGPPDEIALSSSLCTQRSICRGAALASRLDPLTLSGDTRGSSKSLFFAVLNGTFIPDPEPVSCCWDPDNWACRRYTPETSAKDIISARMSFSPRAAIVRLLDSQTFAIQRTPSRLVTTLLSLM